MYPTYSIPTGVITDKTSTPVDNEFTRVLPENSIVSPSNIVLVNITLTQMHFDEAFRFQYGMWPRARSAEWDAHPGKYDFAFNTPSPTISPASSFDSIESLKSTTSKTEEIIIFYDVADISEVNPDFKADSNGQKTTKDDGDNTIRKTTALTVREDHPAHIPFLRPGAKSLFASSFNNLNNDPTSRTVYEGTPTMGDRGVWMNRLDSKAHHAKLAAKKRAIMEAEAIAKEGDEKWEYVFVECGFETLCRVQVSVELSLAVRFCFKFVKK